MKVLFLTEGRNVPAARFRAEQFLPGLRGHGIEGTLSRAWPDKYYLPAWHKNRFFGRLAAALFLLLKFADRLAAVLRAPFYDAVFLQRDLLPWPDLPLLESLLRRLSRRLIFDFDDAVYLFAPEKTAALARMSDAVIAGNGHLRNYALKHRPSAELIPTCVDTARYTPGPGGRKGIVTIGWMGTSSGLPHLAAAADGLAGVLKAGGAELLIVSDAPPAPPFLSGPGVRFRKWSAETELDDLRSFDIGIMPLPDDEFSRGKCGFKLLLYMSCGVPVVASPVGANREIVRDGENGFLAASGAEWLEKLAALVKDAGLRRGFGAAGRRTVEAGYSVDANIARLAGTIKG